MTPDQLRKALEEQPVPEHRPGFWGDLTAELEARTSSPGRRAGWQVAVGAAAAVIVVAGAAVLLIRQPANDPLDGVVAASDPAVTQVPATDVRGDDPTAADTEPPGSAPWDAGTLSLADVPDVLVEEWRRAENQLWCSALYPIDPGVEGTTLRRAEFSGGWGLAWDLPELRSAFGVAGVGSPAWDDIATRMPNAVTYGDQVVGYGGEGFDPAAEQRLAEFAIPGQLCAYQVWSKLGDAHLLELIDSLRTVDGLESPPMTGVASVAEERGPAPWAEPAVPYPDGWPASPTETLAFIPTEGVPTDATVRPTTQPMWSLAWDAPEGPGHDALNVPCRECGRGVVGVTVSSIGPIPEMIPDARWDDGSVGYVIPRVGDPAVPVDRLLFRATGSDDLVPGAPRIDIYIPNLAVVVSVWSHLGTESLFELVDGLRLADPGL